MGFRYYYKSVLHIEGVSTHAGKVRTTNQKKNNNNNLVCKSIKRRVNKISVEIEKG